MVCLDLTYPDKISPDLVSGVKLKFSKPLALIVSVGMMAAVLVPSTLANAATAVSVPGSTVAGFSTNYYSPISDLATPPQLSGFENETAVRVTLTVTNGNIDLSATTTGLTLAQGYYSWVGSSISFSGTQANINASLNNAKLRGASVGSVSISIEASTGTGAVFSTNGHYYDVITGSRTWAQAYENAKTQTVASSVNGVLCTGYLVTITSAAEQTFVQSKVRADSWIGASDDYNYIFSSGTTKKYADQAASEGQWHWVTGPESGTQILSSNNRASTVNSEYNNFASGEPNNWSGSEAYGQIYNADGYWNDLGPGNTQGAYIVEFGGDGCTPAASASSASATFNATAANILAFNSSNFVTGGSASVSGSEVTLTPDDPGTYGTIWSKSRYSLANDFEVNAEVFLGTKDAAGADGIAFVIQPASSAQGSVGGGLGYAGIDPSFAVEIDTYNNGGEGEDHIGLMKGGNTSIHNSWGSDRVLAGVNLEDNQYRKFRFYWNTTDNKVTVQLDLDADGAYETGETIFGAVAADLETYFGAGVPFYWGFTGATGGSSNLQKVKISNYMATARTNTQPTVSVSNVTFARNSSQTINITLSDDLTSQAQWAVTASSNNSVATVSGSPSVTSATAATFTLTSGAAAGNSTITVSATDADGSVRTTTFTATVSLADPGAPTGVTASKLGEGSIKVEWVAPTDNGGTAITDYVVERTSNNGVTWETITDGTSALPSATVTGVNGTTYKFRVKAINSARTGTASAESNAFTLYGTPSAPSNLTITPSTSSMTLSWTAPTNMGGSTITDYIIESSTDSGVTWTTVTDGVSNATTAVISGLTQAVEYIFRVIARNAGNLNSAASSATSGATLLVPLPEPAPVVTPTPTPSPSASVRPTPRPTPSPTQSTVAPRPIATPTATPSPTPTATPSPSAQPVAAPVLQPTVEPTPNVVYQAVSEIPQVLINALLSPIAFTTNDAAEPVLPELAPLESAALVNGTPVPVQLIPTETADGYVLKGEGFEVVLAATSKSGEPLKLDESGNIILNDERVAKFSGSGFAPGSIIKVWLFSEPTELREVIADANGEFSGEAAVPADAPMGEHTIQLNGITQNGELRSVAMGVVLNPDAAAQPVSPTTGSGEINWWLLSAGFAAAALLLVLVTRRRKKA